MKKEVLNQLRGEMKLFSTETSRKSTCSAKRRKIPDYGAMLSIVIYFMMLLAPLVLLSIFRPRTDHGLIYELGKNFALLGFTILILQFVLSGRLKWIEESFGLDILIGFHRFMGVSAMMLLLIHPILLALGGKGWSFLISPDSPWYLWMARAVLLMLLMHTLLSIYRVPLRLEFQKWIQSHRTLALTIIFFGFVHSWWAGGDLTTVQIRILWVSMFSLALCVHLYRRIVQPKRLRRHAYSVIEVLRESHDVWTIRLAPPEQESQLSYYPGQFHFLTFYHSRNLPLEEHPFTISSSPTQTGFIASTIKNSGDFTAKIAHTKPGDLVGVNGPFGRFSYLLDNQGGDLVFIAGGVGITPFMSMLRHMRDNRSDIRVLLLYANKTKKDILFYDELSMMETGQFPSVDVIHILSRPEPDWGAEIGHLDGGKVDHFCGSDLKSMVFYLCGPPGMTGRITRDLRRRGVRDSHIHIEKFSF